MNRRGFLKLTAGGIAAAIAAPYVITTPGLLMKARAPIIVPPGAREVEEWLAECRKRIAESMAMNLEGALTFGLPMTATEVLARRQEAFAIFGQAIIVSMPPDRDWFTLKLRDDKANSA